MRCGTRHIKCSAAELLYSLFSVAVIKYHSQKQAESEGLYFIFWFQGESSRGDTAAGSQSRQLRDHIFKYKQETEVQWGKATHKPSKPTPSDKAAPPEGS